MKFTNHKAASYIKTVALMKSSSQQLRKFSFLNEMAQHCSSNDYLKLVNKYHTFPPQKTMRILTLRFTQICFICHVVLKMLSQRQGNP